MVDNQAVNGCFISFKKYLIQMHLSREVSVCAEVLFGWESDVNFQQHARLFFQSEFLFRERTYVRENRAVCLGVYILRDPINKRDLGSNFIFYFVLPLLLLYNILK